VLDEPFVVQVEYEPSTEGLVRIIDARNDGRVVTVIEFFSPANKVHPEGREKYRLKRDELIAGGVNLVEVDLLRSGAWNFRFNPTAVPKARRTPYNVCVTRGHRAFESELWSIDARRRLPTIRIPLRPTDADVPLDLQALIAQAYLNGSYGYDADYTRPPEPPLPEEDAAWAKSLIAAAM
jgi:hypothetical protein